MKGCDTPPASAVQHPDLDDLTSSLLWSVRLNFRLIARVKLRHTRVRLPLSGAETQYSGS
jgi:hypothetical protein